LKSNVLIAVVISSSWLALGCTHVNNPFVDSSAVVLPELTTASAEGYRGEADGQYIRLQRTRWDGTIVSQENGAVSHWPLWFEDPYEMRGNRSCDGVDYDAPDNDFRWNKRDFIHMAYGPARMLINGVAWPVSAVMMPPGTLMESDGNVSRRIVDGPADATRSDSVMREPPWTSDINKPQPESQMILLDAGRSN